MFVSYRGGISIWHCNDKTVAPTVDMGIHGDKEGVGDE
jgi:hypothetical protein